MKGIKRFLNDQAGVTSIEYALMASLIAMAIIAAVGLLGNNVNILYEKVQQGMAN
jgi:pilus assembly protein Flp/PilA